MNIFPIILLSVLLFFLSGTARSQALLSGVVQDEAGLPLPYANVLLLYPADSSLAKGTVTNDQGVLGFDQVEPGTYLLKVSMTGYENFYLSPLAIESSGKPQALETISLRASSQELETVTVQAQKNLFEQKIDRLVINVQSSITASSGTALDVLERSPQVRVDHYNNAINMSGKSGVQVMINGKLSRMPMEALYQMLSSMQASNIEQIELITTPPANLDAEGDAGYINIVLKANEGNGLNGSFFVNAEKKRRFNSAFGGDLAIRNNRFSLFSNYSFTYERRLTYADIERIMEFPDYRLDFNSHTRRKGGANAHNFRLGMDYQLSPKTVVGVLTTVFDRNWSQVSTTEAGFTINPGQDNLVYGIRRDANPLDQFMMNVNLQHNLAENQQLNLDLDYFYYYSGQPQEYQFRYFTEERLSSQDDIRINKSTPMDIWVAKLDYHWQPSERVSLEAGVKGTYSSFFNNVLFEERRGEEWITDPLFSERASMDELIGAAFASLSFTISETTDLKAGLRYEYTDTELISESQPDEPILRRYGSIFPSLFYSKKLSEHTSWQFSYNRRITRPAFTELAPFVIFLDPLTYTTGNSFLWPAFTHGLKTDLNHKGIILSLQASRTFDAIYRFQPQLDSTNNVTTYSSINVDRADNYVMSFTLPLTIAPWWEVQNNLQGMIQRVETDLEGGGRVRFSQRSFTFNSSHTFNLQNKFSLEVSGFYNSPSINGISRVKAFGAVNVGLRKEFNNNWGRLNLSFSDIFRTNKWLWDTDLPQQYLSESFVFDPDTKSLKLTYTKQFGRQKVKGARKRATGSAEEQKRL